MAFEFPAFSVAPFITPFATSYNPNAAVGNAVHAQGITYQNEQEKARLAEQTREFNEVQPRANFQTFGNQFNQNREYDEREQERATKLLQWVQSMVEDDPEKAQAMAPHIKGILDIHGIQMHLPGEQPEAQPGQPQIQQPAPVSQGEQAIGDIAAMENTPAPVARAPGFGDSEDEGLRELEAAQQANKLPEAEEKALPEENGPRPGEHLQAYFSRSLAPQVPKKEKAPKAQVQAAPQQQVDPQGELAPMGDGEEPNVKWGFSYKGKPIGSIDVYRQADINARRTQGMAKGLTTGAMPKADEPFIKAIMEPILSGAIRTPEQLEKYWKDNVEPELSRRSKERSSYAIASSKAQGPTLGGVSTVHDDIQAIQEHFATRYGVNDLHKRALAAQSAEELVKSDNPMEQRDALTQHLKSMFSSVTSDLELGFASEAAGKLTQIEMKFNSWFSGGELPENYRTLLAEANSIIQEQTKRELDRVGEAAHGYIMRDPTLSLDKGGRTQAAGVVKGYFTGSYDVPEVGGPMGVTGMGKGGGKSSGSVKGSLAAPEMALSPEQKKLMGK